MQVFEDPRAFQEACLAARREGDLGFVPTMGYLHAGHESLMHAASTHRTSALSIFVNPTQFGPKEDLSRYPRDLPGDLARAERCGIRLVLVPAPEDVYPPGFQTAVEPGAVSLPLEGEHRPGHFRGVATVVLKLLQLAQSTHAYFGRKDYQQLAVVRRLVRDLDVPTEIVGLPTVREADGLAMSSRNVYLSPDQRRRALAISSGLRAAQESFSKGNSLAAELAALVRAPVAQAFDTIDYVEVRDADSLLPVERVTAGKAVALVAARIGNTRLIDNHVFE